VEAKKKEKRKIRKKNEGGNSALQVLILPRKKARTQTKKRGFCGRGGSNAQRKGEGTNPVTRH